MKRLVLALMAALTLGLPGTAAANWVDPGGGGGGTPCVYGIMSGEGSYSGWIPYYESNTFTQLTTTITNMNVLGFVGSADISTYPSSHVTWDLYLAPTVSATIVGPTYTTPIPNTSGVPFRIYLSAVSDAVSLAYKVCV